MEKVYPRLYVGSQWDYEKYVSKEGEKWSILHAAKEPYHREFVGYSTKGAPQDSPEYLWARRGNRLALNLIDGPTSEYFSLELFSHALTFIGREAQYRPVLIHCNEGKSRAPSLALLYLAAQNACPSSSLEEAEAEFILHYPNYVPGQGIREFLFKHWHYFCNDGMFPYDIPLHLSHEE